MWGKQKFLVVDIPQEPQPGPWEKKKKKTWRRTHTAGASSKGHRVCPEIFECVCREIFESVSGDLRVCVQWSLISKMSHLAVLLVILILIATLRLPELCVFIHRVLWHGDCYQGNQMETLEPSPSVAGSASGEIYFCKFCFVFVL